MDSQDMQKVLAPDRQRLILDLINSRGTLKIKEICREINASASTVRRDLDKLGNDNYIVRIHGGATSVGNEIGRDSPMFVYEERAGKFIQEKKAIALAAAEYIEKDETIFLDDGSTALELAKLIKYEKSLIVITTSIHVAAELTQVEGPRVIISGGEVRPKGQDMVRALVEPVLENIFLNKAFFGTNTLTTTGMTTTDDPSQSITKQIVARVAQTSYVMVDSSKFGTNGFFIANKPDDIDMYITDSHLSPELRKLYEDKFKLNIRYVDV